MAGVGKAVQKLQRRLVDHCNGATGLGQVGECIQGRCVADGGARRQKLLQGFVDHGLIGTQIRRELGGHWA